MPRLVPNLLCTIPFLALLGMQATANGSELTQSTFVPTEADLAQQQRMRACLAQQDFKGKIEAFMKVLESADSDELEAEVDAIIKEHKEIDEAPSSDDDAQITADQRKSICDCAIEIEYDPLMRMDVSANGAGRLCP